MSRAAENRPSGVRYLLPFAMVFVCEDGKEGGTKMLGSLLRTAAQLTMAYMGDDGFPRLG